MEMTYTSKRGKQIVFDDYVDNTLEFNSYWVEICPHCHNKLFYLDNESTNAICGLCGMVGEVVIEDGKTKFVFPVEQLEHAHDTIPGKFIHGDDIQRMEGAFAKVRQTEEFKLRKKRYMDSIASSFLCERV